MKPPNTNKMKVASKADRKRQQEAAERLRNQLSESTKATHSKFHPLPICLSAAVPLWIERMRDWPIEAIFDSQALERIQDVFMRNGEAILYRIEGKSAESFNALAEGIARLSFCQGGVSCFNMHFDGRRRFGTGEYVKPETQ